jgi:hypothetical protein
MGNSDVDRFITYRLLHNEPPESYTGSFSEARRYGATGVALVPHYYTLLAPNSATLSKPKWSPKTAIWADSGQVYPGFANTIPDDNIVEIFNAAKASGFKILLKPHIDCGWWHDGTGYGVGGWRGALVVPSNLIWQFTTNYKAMLRPLIHLARTISVSTDTAPVMLSIGCELLQITREWGVDFWISIAKWVRAQGFKGHLTYAANWGEEVQTLLTLWKSGLLNSIGCDWYVPQSQWDGQVKLLRDLEQATGIPVLFTEVGYCNWAGTLEEPWHDWQFGDIPTNALQLEGWTRFRTAWPNNSYVAWEGPVISAGELPVNHNVLRTPELATLVLSP